MESNSEKLTCHHCEKDNSHIAYLLTCPGCSWTDFYCDKDDHCTICDEASTLGCSHVTGFLRFMCERSFVQQVRKDSLYTKCGNLPGMNPEAREEYERYLVRNRPKYIPMKPEEVAKLPPEERQEYENALKVTKTPKLYALRSRH